MAKNDAYLSENFSSKVGSSLGQDWRTVVTVYWKPVVVIPLIFLAAYSKIIKLYYRKKVYFNAVFY